MIVLAIGAHPDDETGFTGGMLAKYAADGNDVYVLLTTRGEGGSMGDPPLCERSELGALREAEARAAGAALGLRDILFLPYQDPEIGDGNTLHPIDVSLSEFSGAIAQIIADLRPDVVLTHGSGGEYGHPQHVFTHRAVFEALEQLRPWRPKEILTWCAAYPDPEKERFINADDPADVILDTSPWMPQKIQAFSAYRSQWPVFFRNNQGKSLDEIPIRVESFRRWS